MLGWDDRLQLNTAVFYTEYEDALIDIAILEAPQYVASFNAGQATIRGIELTSRPCRMNHCGLDASYAYLDAKFDEVVDPRRVPISPATTRCRMHRAMPSASRPSNTSVTSRRVAST
jgi:outer membrane receptor for monomeric catechols